MRILVRKAERLVELPPAPLDHHLQGFTPALGEHSGLLDLDLGTTADPWLDDALLLAARLGLRRRRK